MKLLKLLNKKRTVQVAIWSLFTSLLVGVVIPIVESPIAEAAGPGGITATPLLWLDATDIDSNTATSNPANGSAVSSWTDKSSNTNNASVLSGQGTPTYAANSPINNGPAIHFTRTGDAAGQVYVVSGVDIRAGTRADVTVFAVYQAETATAGQLYGIWGQDNGAWDRFAICCGYQNVDTRGVVGLPPSGFGVNGAGQGTRLLTVVYDGNVSAGVNYGPVGGSSVWFEGGQVTTFTDSTTASTADGPGSAGAKPNFRIGWDGDNSAFNGWISELIIYGSALSSSDIIAVSNYLGEKYNLTIAPTPVTQAATSITSSAATLNGTVNAHNDATSAITIRYSNDSSSVINNTAVSATVSPTQVSGNSNVSVSASISGLSPGTRYYFRVSATNSRGSNDGALLSFTTLETTIDSCLNSAGNNVGRIVNGSFENLSGSESYVDGNFPLGWKTTALASRASNTKVAFETLTAGSVNASQVTITNSSDATSVDGSVIAEIAADSGGDSSTAVQQGLYQDVNTVSGARIFWSYWHHYRAGGSNSNPQISRFRAAATPTGVPNGNIFSALEQANPFGANASLLSDAYDTATSTTAWRQSRGSFVATSDRTRLLIQNHQTPSNGYGNLIDDVRFTVFQACPISVKIVAGRSASLTIRNSEQTTGSPAYYGPAASTVSIATANANLSTLGVTNAANTSATFTIAGSSIGVQNSTYRVTYSIDGETFTSVSTLSVEVVGEITAKRPTLVPFDPTLPSKALPGIKFSTATRGYVCYKQVANANGDDLASPTVALSRSSILSGISNIQSDTTIIDSGTVANLSNQAALLRVTSNVGKLGIGGSKFIKVQASSIDNTDDSAPACSNGISFVIEFRRIKITQTRTFTVPQKNGKQT